MTETGGIRRPDYPGSPQGSVNRVGPQAARPGEPASVWSHLAAACAGVVIGTIVVLPVGFLAMTLGTLLLSVIYKRIAGLIAFYGTVLIWWAALPPLFASPVHGEGIAWYELGEGFRAIVFCAGLLIAAGFYWVGGRLRPSSEWLVTRLAALVGAAACIILLVGTVSLAAPWKTSFDFSLPAGWNVGVSAAPGFESGGSCRDYSAEGSPSTDSDGAVPILCVEVAESPGSAGADPSPAADAQACYRVEDLGGGPSIGLYDWQLQATPNSPPIPGAYEEVRQGPAGETLYGLGVTRNRQIGPATDSVCYLISLTVPKGSSMTEADVNSLLGTFRYR